MLNSTGSSGPTVTEFAALSGPPHTAVIRNVTAVNKGNVAAIYTNQFNDEPTIDGEEMLDLLTQQQEEAEQETLDNINKHRIKPFQWSESEYNRPKSHADRWAFETYKPAWAW